MDCAEYRKLIDAYLEGELTGEQQERLRAHEGECAACCELYAEVSSLGESVREAFSAEQGAASARALILEAIKQEPVGARIADEHRGGRAVRSAVAAGVMLALGLGLGWVWGRSEARALAPATALAEGIRVAEVEGVVLVNHVGQEIWRALTRDAAIYVGDRFESAGRAQMTLSLGETSTLVLTERSSLALKSFNGGIDFGLSQGTVQADLASPHGPFYVSTPQGRIEALGTEFIVTVD